VQYGLSVDNFNLSEKYFYPNPARGQITMVKPGTLRIFDAAGRCVLQCKVSASQVVSIHALPVGVYTLKVNDSAAMPLLHY
jgi:hypothetical protein